MKKLLIATAALAMVAGTAQAQSSVTVYGVLSTGHETMKSSDSEGNSIKETTTGRQGAQSGSRLGFRGTEDLGGGTKAGFVYELGVDMNTAIASAPRLAFLELANDKLGTLRAGRVDSLTRQATNTYTSHGNSGFEAGNTAASMARLASMGLTAVLAAYNSSASYAETAGAATNSSTNASAAELRSTRASRFTESAADQASLTWGQGAGRTSNTIGYISPSFSGVQLHAQIGKVESDVSGIDSQTVPQNTQAFGITYNAGSLSVMAATSTEKTKSVEINPNSNAGDTKNKTNIFGASYDFKVVKAFAMYTDRELKRENGTYSSAYTFDGIQYGRAVFGNYQLDQKDTTLGVSIPLGKVVLVGSYSMGDIKFSDEATKDDVDGYQLQANYLFSKRTKAYLMYGETKLKDTDGTVKLKGTVAGVQHSF